MLMNAKFGMNVIKIVKILLDCRLHLLFFVVNFGLNLDMYVLVEPIIHLKVTIDVNILTVNILKTE